MAMRRLKELLETRRSTRDTAPNGKRSIYDACRGFYQACFRTGLPAVRKDLLKWQTGCIPPADDSQNQFCVVVCVVDQAWVRKTSNNFWACLVLDG